MKEKDLATSMANVVFTPTLLAYGWIMVGYVASGLVVYLLFLIAAYKMGLFRDVLAWPTVSKAALFWSPVHIAIALYCSTQKTSYQMLLPELAYLILVIAGGLALRGKIIG